MNYIIEYNELIKKKKIIVSKKVKKQIDKLIYLLENQDKYIFDEDKANRSIEFIETFCRHSKGKWAGKKIELDLWQKMILQATFGFIYKDTGLRKYKELLIIVARKNGKSTLLSGIALYMLIADGEGGPQICCVASKKDQAKIVFNESKNMVSQSPLLSKHIKKRKSDLYTELGFGTFEPLANDSNTLDGLNMHCGIIDELHSIKDRNIYDVSKQSMSTREQPLLVMISTAGFVRESIYDDTYEYAEKVLDDIIEDEEMLSFIYELDERKEYLNERNWIKANPGLGTIKSISSLRANVKKSKEDKKFLPSLLTKDFNIRETGAGAWLRFEDINNAETFDITEFKDSYGVAGVDLSSVGDLTCASVIIRKDKKLYLHQMYWIPEERAELKEKEDKVPYSIWNDKGYIRFSKSNKVEYADITEWFVELREKYSIYILWCGYDQWNASYWVKDMINNGYVLEDVIQGAKTMSGPMKLLAADLQSKLINYNNNPILKWCLTNTQIEVDKNENIRPIKGKNKKQRIDGTVSLIDAYVVYQRHYDDYINMTGGN